MASKTVQELSKLSANLTAFDLPVHDGGQSTTLHEPPRGREHPNDRMPRASRAVQVRTKKAAEQQAATSKTTLGAFISAASIDGPTARLGMRWPRESAPQPVGGLAKRILDIVVAATAVVLLSPLLLMVALLVYATMGRPILFPQRRLGFDGHSFGCIKFRTMVNDAETALESHLADNPEAAHEWRVRQKLQNDPRVTVLGSILRRSSLDELPQLFNVLKGDMSCVGPRPVVQEEIARYGRYWKFYMKARPGLTGAWQVSGRNRLSYPRRVALDSDYVRNWSIGRDLWILLKTIPAVLKSDTA